MEKNHQENNLSGENATNGNVSTTNDPAKKKEIRVWCDGWYVI